MQDFILVQILDAKANLNQESPDLRLAYLPSFLLLDLQVVAKVSSTAELHLDQNLLWTLPVFDGPDQARVHNFFHHLCFLFCFLYLSG